MGDMAELYDDNPCFDDRYLQYDPDPSRKFPRWSFNKKKKRFTNMKNLNKFYIGAEHIAQDIANNINSDWTHATFESAKRQAEHIMELEDKECVIIVKIVAIVKRKKQPIVTEIIK